MKSKFTHIPVLLKEVMNGMKLRPSGRYLDCTFGNGGYSRYIVENCADSQLIAVDRDPLAYQRAQVLASEYAAVGIGAFDGIMLDLGVSSMQIDDPSRGFSYQKDGPLDMRMDNSPADEDVSAFDVVNYFPPHEISEILTKYGDERFAKRIANAISQRRSSAPITWTKELVETIYSAIPSKYRNTGSLQHPAMRTFQAIRIFVNQEMKELEDFLKHADRLVLPGGRIAIVTFHSTEDRIVKRFFKESQTFEPISKPIVPSDEEVENNPRSRSAKLRVAEKR